jgi:hypothetical protein
MMVLNSEVLSLSPFPFPPLSLYLCLVFTHLTVTYVQVEVILNFLCKFIKDSSRMREGILLKFSDDHLKLGELDKLSERLTLSLDSLEVCLLPAHTQFLRTLLFELFLYRVYLFLRLLNEQFFFIMFHFFFFFFFLHLHSEVCVR